jgi:uncharacterized protein with NRDE domain
MCILYLLIGNDNYPTLICNNRDEYFTRPTQRGSVSRRVDQRNDESVDMGRDEHYSYSPKDLLGGGSWIQFDNISHRTKELRFAVVLNFHHWREYTIWSFLTLSYRINMSKLKSRGKLVSQFIENSTITAKEYADLIFTTRGEYRPFNLIVSDGSDETYYISSSSQQLEIRKLHSGELYGITNGYIDDPWEKVLFGKELMQDVLSSNFPSASSSSSLSHSTIFSPDNVSQQLQEKNNAGRDFTHSQPVNRFLSEIFDVMKEKEPLTDPTFNKSSLALMQLAAIFVIPTIIIKDEHLTILTRFGNGKFRTISSPQEAVETPATVQTLPKAENVVVKDNTAIDRDEIFGTRTVTILLCFNRKFLTKHQVDPDPSLPSSDSSKSSISIQQYIPSSRELPPLFTILESDYTLKDDYSLAENINVFSNF